jgi:hypothetical protein
MEVFDGCGLNRNPGIVGGLDQPAHDRYKLTGEHRLVSRQRPQLEAIDEDANLAGEREQRVLELRHGRLG